MLTQVTTAAGFRTPCRKWGRRYLRLNLRVRSGLGRYRPSFRNLDPCSGTRSGSMEVPAFVPRPGLK